MRGPLREERGDALVQVVAVEDFLLRRMAQVGVGLTAGALSVGAALALPADAPLGPRTASGVERLQSFADCDELTAWYVKQALHEVTPWGFGRPMPVMYDAAVRVEGAAPAVHGLQEVVHVGQDELHGKAGVGRAVVRARAERFANLMEKRARVYTSGGVARK